MEPDAEGTGGLGRAGVLGIAWLAGVVLLVSIATVHWTLQLAAALWFLVPLGLWLAMAERPDERRIVAEAIAAGTEQQAVALMPVAVAGAAASDSSDEEA